MKLILAVDDEPGIYEVCRRSLSRKGYSVSTALSGEEAIDLLKTESFDLALVDLRMPGVDGFELLNVLRKTTPRTNVIVISAESTVQAAVDCMKAGALDYIMKPFDLDELLARIDHAFECGEKIAAMRDAHKPVFDQLTDRIKDDHSKENVLTHVLDQAATTVHADAGYMFTVSPGGSCRLLHSCGHRMEYGDAGEFIGCIADWVLNNRRPALIDGSLSAFSEFKELSCSDRFASSLLLPLIRRQELLGFISLHRLASNDQERIFTPQDLETGKHFALYAELVLSMQYQNKLHGK